MKKSILFVDDSRELLEGLERSLRKDQAEWEMVFTDSGDSALNMLRQRAFDVLVADLHMPPPSGEVVMAEARDLYPNMVRIMFTGNAERETARRLGAMTHGYVVKPCDADMLMSVIQLRYRLASREFNKAGGPAPAKEPVPGGSLPSVDLNEILKLAVASTKNEWKDVAVVETHLATGAPRIAGHAAKLTSLFVNIIVNAAQTISARGIKGGRIVVSTAAWGKGCEVRIGDSGTKVPEKLIEKGADATSEDFLAAGQPWLAIAHDTLVRFHSGQFACAREPGLETVFVMRIP